MIAMKTAVVSDATLISWLNRKTLIRQNPRTSTGVYNITVRLNGFSGQDDFFATD